jgi:hypothetical protein
LTETYTYKGFTVTAKFPDRTQEEKENRKREVEQNLRTLYLKMKREGRNWK